MKRQFSIGAALVLTMFMILGTAYAQQGTAAGKTQQTPAPGQQQARQGGWYCPWCGGYQGGNYSPGMRGYGNMGPGMMRGYGMGSGMMGEGYGMGQGMRQYYGEHHRYGQQGGEPLSESQVKKLVENYVQNTGNPNLKVGKITKPEGKDYYVATITTKDGSLVDKIEVNEYTGWFRTAYGG